MLPVKLELEMLGDKGAGCEGITHAWETLLQLCFNVFVPLPVLELEVACRDVALDLFAASCNVCLALASDSKKLGVISEAAWLVLGLATRPLPLLCLNALCSSGGGKRQRLRWSAESA